MADLFGTPEEGLEETVARSLDILERVEARFKPDRVIALFSGGHDSLCATHLASRFRRFDGVAHINTGIGVEETREFVRTTCARYGWPLRELTPPPRRPLRGRLPQVRRPRQGHAPARV